MLTSYLPLSKKQVSLLIFAPRQNPSDQMLALKLAEMLSPVAGGLSGLYLIFAVAHYFLLPFAQARYLVSSALLTAFLLGGLAFLLKRFPTPSRLAHLMGALIAALPILNSLLHLTVSAAPQQTTNLCLVAIAIGGFFLCTRWVIALFLALIGGWLFIALRSFSPDWIHFGFALVSSLVLSFLLHVTRVRAMRRLAVMRIQEEQLNHTLAESLASAQEHVRLAQAAEREARERKQVLRSFYDAASIMMGIIEKQSTELIHLSGNQRSADFFGLSPLDLDHKRMSELGFSPAELERWAAQLKNCEITQHPVHFDYLPEDCSSLRVFAVTLSYITTTPQGHARFSYLAEEVTERRRVEAELRHSQSLFHSYMSNIPAVAFMKGEDGRYVYVNDELTRLFRVSLTDLRDKTDADWLPQATAQELWATDLEVLATGQPKQIIETVATPDGTVHDWLSYKFPFRDQQGRRYVGGMAFNVTEQRRAEERFRQMFEACPHGLLLVDPSGRIHQINAQAEQMFGYSATDLLNCPLEILLPGSQYSEFVATATDLAATRKCRLGNAGDDLQIRRRDGLSIPVEVQVTLLTMPEGTLGLLSVVDLSGRRQAETAIRERELQLRQLSNNLRNGFVYQFLERPEGTPQLLYVSAAIERLLGVSVTDALADITTATDTMHEEDLARVRDIVERARLRLEPVECTFRSRHRQTGEIRWSKISRSPILQADGSCLWNGLYLDITEEKLREEERNRLLTILENTTDYIGMATADFHRIYTNQAFGQLIGSQNPQPIQNQLPGWVREKMAQEVIPTVRREGVWRGEMAFLNTEGNEVPVSQVVIGHSSSSGEIEYFSTIARNISEEKQVRANLEQARALAEAATRAKSEFLATMSHEIRTPMNGILGMSQLALDTELTAEQQECIQTVYSCAQSLLTLLNDILDFSKVEAGKLALEAHPFDLRATAEDIIDLLGAKARENQLDLLLNYAPDLPTNFLGDAGRLRQILLNLVSNAVKFTPQGHVLIEVTGKRVSASEASLRIEVQDTGIGIAAEMLPLLFQEFVQADSTISRRYGGTGLGLAICQRLIKLMGGEIGVTSQIGQGTTFFFTLQLPIESGNETPTNPSQADSDKQILVMDRNPEVSLTLCGQLEVGAWQTERVATPEEVLARLQQASEQGAPFPLVLLNEAMPEVDAETLTRAIKADPALAATAIIIHSSVAKRGDAQRFQAAGALGYLTKPARAEALQQVVEAVWQWREQGGHPEGIITYHLLQQQTALTQTKIDPQPDGKRRVLLVDDNVINQKVGTMMLAKMGCQSKIAASGREALEMVAQNAFDLIFMDCQMPEMDGLETTRRLREMESTRELPIIAMTGSARDEDRDACFQAGMSDFLTKPVEFPVLQKMVTQWLALQRE